MTINTTQLKAFGLFSMTGATGLVIMGAFDSATKFVNTLPRETVIRLTDTLPVMTLALCGFTFAGGVLIAWAFSIARMRPMSASTSSASVGQQQLAPSPIRQLPPPIAQSEPRFAPYRGDIAAMVQREQQRAQYADDADNGPENPEIATYSSDYGHPAQQYDDVPQTPTYAPQGPEMGQNATNQRIIARLGDGSEINISSAAWLAFVQMQKPNREQWRQQLQTTGAAAPNADYSKCKTIAEQYHLLNGAGCWISPKMRDNVTQWLINP